MNIAQFVSKGGHYHVDAIYLFVGFSIQNEAMDAARSAPQRAHFHADVLYVSVGLFIQGESVSDT